MDVPLLTELQYPFILFIIALLIRGIFAFLETTITAMRLFKLKELASSTGRYEHLFHTLEKNPHRILITILIVSSFADVTCAAIATNITETIFQYWNFSTGLGFSLGVGIAGLTIIIFGEILPKNLARLRGERMFRSLIWLVNLAYYVLYPLVSVLIWFSDTILYYISGKQEETSSEWVASEGEVHFLINYIHDKGIMETEKSEMLKNIFEIGRIPVKDIMVPTTDIVSVAKDTPINQVLDIFAKHRFTRLPIFDGTVDNIIGMVHQKDIFYMLSHKENKVLSDLVRPILFVPESLKVNQLLREFRQQQMHIAIVLNEHGSVIGLITLEDVLEEIVGEISDEHEPSPEKILKLQHGGWLVDASVQLDELGKALDVTFETEDSVTLGGFLTEKLQHLPKKGERVLYKHFYFQIQKASPKRVQQVLIFQEKNETKQ